MAGSEWLASAGLAILVVGVAVVASNVPSTEVGSVNTEDFERIVIRDASGGFVGETGTVLTIERDGSFDESRFLNDVQSEPHRSGVLTAAERMEIVALVHQHAFADLLPRLGGTGPANSRELSLTVGERTISGTVPRSFDTSPSETTAEANDPQTEGLRAIVRGIREVTGSSGDGLR